MNRKLIALLLACALAFAMTACGGGDTEQTETEPPETKAATEATKPAKKELTDYQIAYKEKLDSMIDEYGGDLTGGKLTDMDDDGVPEMLVIHNMKAELFAFRDGQVEQIYEGTAGLKYGQTDTSYEILLNESISPSVLMLFNAKDEWVDENISVVTVSGGEASVKSLQASTNGDNDTPAREELQNFSIDGNAVSAEEYENEYNRLITGADSINPTAADLDALQTALTN